MGGVLSDQLVEAGGNVEGYECRNPDDGESCGVLTITLEVVGSDEPYVLRMAKIRVGEGATRSPPDTSPTSPTGTSESLKTGHRSSSSKSAIGTTTP